jgi:hypothetical protein
MDADARMSQPWSTGHERNSGATREFGRRLGHIGRRRFMPAGDDTHRITGIVERIQHVQVTLARHGVYMANIVRAKALDNGIGNSSHTSLPM